MAVKITMARYEIMLLRESHPQSKPLSKTRTSAERAAPKVMAPHQSNKTVFFSETDSRTKATAIKRPMTPTGKLTKKMERQPKLSMSGPPISGPKTEAAAKEADQKPK